MCDTGKMSIIPPVATFETLQVKPDEILVVKIDTKYYDLHKAGEIYQEIVNSLPEGVNCIGIPKGIELEPTLVKDLIKILEEML